ncbi:MAG: hypothetical protein IPP34_11195 [Bacteroidetes bacterium]|nr:hypothetical protein [Bacteroidota bacterium]
MSGVEKEYSTNYKIQLMNRILLLLILLFTTSTAYAQGVQTKGRKVSSRNQRIILAKDQIKQLKEGALFFRLKTRKNSIAAVRKMGKEKLADKLEKRQSDYNLSIISAFNTKFKFCPTYFFFSNDSTEIKENDFDKVIFLNNRLLEDSTIKFTEQYFLIADFATIEQDTAKYFSYYSFEPRAIGGVMRISNYHGGPNMGLGALIVRSKNFIQLKRPFPYYVRNFDSQPKERSHEKAVRRLNKKLYKFYYKEYN